MLVQYIYAKGRKMKYELNTKLFSMKKLSSFINYIKKNFYIVSSGFVILISIIGEKGFSRVEILSRLSVR